MKILINALKQDALEGKYFLRDNTSVSCDTGIMRLFFLQLLLCYSLDWAYNCNVVRHVELERQKQCHKDKVFSIGDAYSD